MSIVLRAPSAELAPFVAALAYYGTGPADGRDLLLLTGQVHLAVNLAEDRARWYDGADTAHSGRGTVLWGAAAGPVGVDLADQRAMVGVLFRPGGAYPFFGPAPSAADAPLVELEALWGRDGATLRERVLEARRRRRRWRPWRRCCSPGPSGRGSPIRRPPGRQAQGRGARVAEVTGRLGMSHGRFLRRFTEQVGLTPSGSPGCGGCSAGSPGSRPARRWTGRAPPPSAATSTRPTWSTTSAR